VQEVLEKYADLRFEPPGRNFSSHASRDASPSSDVLGALGGAIERVARGFRRDRATEKRYFLLYLNRMTWLGAAGSKLADQVCASPRTSTKHLRSATPADRSASHTLLQPAAQLLTPSRCAPRATRTSA